MSAGECVSDFLPNIIGESAAIKDIAEQVIKVAGVDVNVLISGSSGTGKELIARSIHSLSPRNNASFIPIDCVALPATLLESELFGFEKGAFTGAVQSKLGLFELAHKGTIFLDEITELEQSLQAKLLRVLQERQFRRIGGKQTIDVDVRVISATNRNPEEAVKDRWLRNDLYYRLNVVPLRIPPLCERKEDIRCLIRHFIKKYSPFSRTDVQGVSEEVVQCLMDYPWPGNVRELENVMQRMISMADHETIQLSDVPLEYIEHKESAPVDLIGDLPYKEARDQCLSAFKKDYFQRLIETHNGNVSQISRVSGLSRAMIYRIFKDFDISV